MSKALRHMLKINIQRQTDKEKIQSVGVYLCVELSL